MQFRRKHLALISARRIPRGELFREGPKGSASALTYLARVSLRPYHLSFFI